MITIENIDDLKKYTDSEGNIKFTESVCFKIDINTNGWSIDAVGDINTTNNDINTNGGSIKICGGLVTNGGHIYTGGGNIETGGDIMTWGGNIDTAGGDIITRGGDINTNGGNINTGYGYIDTSGGTINIKSGKIRTKKILIATFSDWSFAVGVKKISTNIGKKTKRKLKRYFKSKKFYQNSDHEEQTNIQFDFKTACAIQKWMKIKRPQKPIE